MVNSDTDRKDARCGECVEKSRNQELKKKTMKEWGDSIKGKKYRREYNNKYKPIRNAKNKERCLNDTAYKLTKNTRSLIFDNLKKHGERRIGKIKYLGMEPYYYKKWLGYQFDKHMTWDNYGKYWQIDHVFPIAKFDLTIEEEIYACFDWKNTRPLEASANGSKSDNIDKKIIENHKITVMNFLIYMFKKTGKNHDNGRPSYYTRELFDHIQHNMLDDEEIIDI